MGTLMKFKCIDDQESKYLDAIEYIHTAFNTICPYEREPYEFNLSESIEHFL